MNEAHQVRVASLCSEGLAHVMRCLWCGMLPRDGGGSPGDTGAGLRGHAGKLTITHVPILAISHKAAQNMKPSRCRCAPDLIELDLPQRSLQKRRDAMSAQLLGRLPPIQQVCSKGSKQDAFVEMLSHLAVQQVLVSRFGGENPAQNSQPPAPRSTR